MNKSITKKYSLKLFFFLVFIVVSVFYASPFFKKQEVFANSCPAQKSNVINETDYSIDGNDDRYIGGGKIYDYYRGGTGCSDCSPDKVPASSLNERYKTPAPAGSLAEEVLSRELVNKNWSLICDSQSKNNIVHYSNSYCGGDYSKTTISDESKVYIDLGSENEKVLDRIRFETDNPSDRYWANGLVWEGFNDEHNITLTSYTNSSGVTPDEMLRIDIYVGDVFLKTIFPESTVANFKLKGSEVLRLINGSYRVFPDGSDNKGQSGIQMRVFGHNGQKTISSRTSVFTPNDNYLPDITPDMTVYRKTSTWGGIGDVAFITFNSLKEPIYFNQYYIDPSMTPITLKADDGNDEFSAGLHFSGNYILGDGWYMDPEGTTVGYETVGIGDYNAEDSIFYQGEPIYESAYQHNTGHEKIISNLRLNGASVSYRFDSDTGNISISGIPLGENNISYDIAVPSLGNSTSVDKDIYIIERDGLDRVRQNSFNNDKYHHEANVKISYETSWGTSGEEEKGLSYYSSAGFSNITMKQIIFSRMLSSDAMVGFVRARPSIYNATSSGFIPIQDDMRYRVDFH